MPPRTGLQHAEANAAAWEAARGAVVGASWWALYGAGVAAAGYTLSPIYRGLTFQFKVFIQMSSMIMGGMLGADRQLREYEAKVRVQRRMAIDRATWERFERDFGEEAVGREGKGEEEKGERRVTNGGR